MPRQQWRTQAQRIAQVLHDIAVPPQVEKITAVHDTTLRWAASTVSNTTFNAVPFRPAESVAEYVGALAEVPALVLNEWPQ